MYKIIETKKYQKIFNMIKEYLSGTTDAEASEKFCNLYMDKFYELSDELEQELSQINFELLDELNLVCDSYEKNSQIRNEDKYCIDEKSLRKKVNNIYNALKN